MAVKVALLLRPEMLETMARSLPGCTVCEVTSFRGLRDLLRSALIDVAIVDPYASTPKDRRRLPSIFADFSGIPILAYIPCSVTRVGGDRPSIVEREYAYLADSATLLQRAR